MPDFGAFVGIDVGRDELVVQELPAGRDGDAEGGGRAARFPDTPAGIGRLLVWLPAGPVLVVLEATGGYEHRLWQALAGSAETGVLARQLCPRRVLSFARARGRLHKTDRIDAITLAEYALHFPGQGRSWPGKSVQRLSLLVMRRRALVETRKGVMVRRARCEDPGLGRLDAQLEGLLDRQIAAVEALIEKALAADAELAEKEALLRSVPGIGAVLSSSLLSRMCELGQVDDRKAAALAGVAPMADDSGKRQGSRRIAGGRQEVRAVLFQAAMCAMHHHPELKAFAARLRAAGKKHKVIVIAVARKLLLQANAVLRRGTPWVRFPVTA